MIARAINLENNTNRTKSQPDLGYRTHALLHGPTIRGTSHPVPDFENGYAFWVISGQKMYSLHIPVNESGFYFPVPGSSAARHHSHPTITAHLALTMFLANYCNQALSLVNLNLLPISGTTTFLDWPAHLVSAYFPRQGFSSDKATENKGTD